MDLGCAPSLVCLSLALLFSASAEGQSINATVGQDVILPCQASNYMPFKVVEWSRDEAEVKYVLIFDKANPNLKVPEQSYKGRVDVANMEEGDVSLKLNNVTLEDRGRYECYAVRETKRNKRAVQPINTVYLHVLAAPSGPAPPSLPPPSQGHIGLIPGLIATIAVFAVVAGFAGFAVFVWKKRSASPPQDETVAPLQA